MLMLSILALAAAQPQPVAIRPGTAPEGVSAVPISETAEPIGLAVAGFDADGDGRTSVAELEQALGRTFGAADRDGNAALGYIEYAGWAETWLGSATALPGPFAIDGDGDNRLTRAEFGAEFRRQFSRLDKNADGAVTRAELLTLQNPRLAPVLDRNGRPIRVRERRRER